MHIVAKTQAKSKGGSEFFQNFCHNGLIRRYYAVDVCVVGMFATVDGKRCLRRYEVDFVVNTDTPLPMETRYLAGWKTEIWMTIKYFMLYTHPDLSKNKSFG